jgi:hypothetical protein
MKNLAVSDKFISSGRNIQGAFSLSSLYCILKEQMAILEAQLKVGEQLETVIMEQF